MPVPLSTLRKLYKAFVRSDSNRRKERIQRTLWRSENLTFEASYTSDYSIESSRLEAEAAKTFVDGHYIATLLLVLSYCEHTLTDWLYLSGKSPQLFKRKPTLEQIKEEACSAGLFNTEFWSEFTRLKDIRNAYAHRKWEFAPTHEQAGQTPDDLFRLHANTLTSRFRESGKSRQVMLEEDAKAALLLMDKMRHLRHHSGITRDPWLEFSTTE